MNDHTHYIVRIALHIMDLMRELAASAVNFCAHFFTQFFSTHTTPHDYGYVGYVGYYGFLCGNVSPSKNEMGLLLKKF
jgi:hypothetical protein